MEISYENFIKLVNSMPDTPQKGGECPVIKTLNIIQGKWKAYVLFFLCQKDKSRFGEIHKSNPQISKTMLSTVLK